MIWFYFISVFKWLLYMSFYLLCKIELRPKMIGIPTINIMYEYMHMIYDTNEEWGMYLIMKILERLSWCISRTLTLFIFPSVTVTYLYMILILPSTILAILTSETKHAANDSKFQRRSIAFKLNAIHIWHSLSKKYLSTISELEHFRAAPKLQPILYSWILNF